MHRPLFVGSNASLIGVYVGAYTKPLTSDVHQSLLKLWREEKIASLVSKEVPFEAAARALGELAGRSAVGKIVVRV